ncbi:MAG: DNA-binding protein [Treponema sp.]|nr:DNA-binding protein [Treponema sp.]
MPFHREEEKFYLIPSYAGELTLDSLAEVLSNACTLNKADVYAVLKAFSEQLPWYLQNGFIIALDNFGRLRLSVCSRGQIKATDVSTADIIKARVLFNPSIEIKRALIDTSYRIV